MPDGSLTEKWDGKLDGTVKTLQVDVRGDAIALVAVQELGFRYFEVDVARLR